MLTPFLQAALLASIYRHPSSLNTLVMQGGGRNAGSSSGVWSLPPLHLAVRGRILEVAAGLGVAAGREENAEGLAESRSRWKSRASLLMPARMV